MVDRATDTPGLNDALQLSDIKLIPNAPKEKTNDR
jgi:hypothetical protein